MTDRIKTFMEQVSSDETLKAELKNTLQSTEKKVLVSNIIQFAKKHGHELTEEDFAFGREELNSQELEAITGGGGCGCPVIGGGSGDGLFCFCGGGGCGGVDGSMDPSSQGGCVCPVVGIGATRRH